MEKFEPHLEDICIVKLDGVWKMCVIYILCSCAVIVFISIHMYGFFWRWLLEWISTDNSQHCSTWPWGYGWNIEFTLNKIACKLFHLYETRLSGIYTIKWYPPLRNGKGTHALVLEIYVFNSRNKKIRICAYNCDGENFLWLYSCDCTKKKTSRRKANEQRSYCTYIFLRFQWSIKIRLAEK